ncbi:MAG: alpha/beta fold hydrolase [Gemmatimonadetes bacterium]|nr:alpha/beta fold hydrolase [Gemmatimonadota bacterium]MBI3569295.1 alpha/beta fold hydrolase [Gemmatimonadota bacterium]
MTATSLVIGSLVSTRLRLPPAEWYPAGHPDIEVARVALGDGVSLRVLSSGPASGPPVVLVHGWAISAYLWRHTIPALAAAGFRAYAADLPGCGLSDAPTAPGSYTLDAMTTWLARLYDALGLDAAPLAAQSMGARIAVELARRAPARVPRLALYGPAGFGDIAPASAFAPFIPRLPGAIPSLLVTRDMVDFVQRRVHGKLGWFTDRDTDEYWAPTQFPDVVRAQLQMLAEFDWAPHDERALATLATPTMVVFGTADRTVRPVHAERLVRVMPRGRLEWIEGGGHVVMEESPEYVNRQLVAFLREGRGADGA